uniref:Genome polyprotein n=1 Tax=Salivirus sewage Bangkok TaxID=1224524 RepID=J7LDH1_9PICO|nr:polyprotein [Salivirus sewage Bangkok]
MGTLTWSESQGALQVFSGPKALSPGVYPPTLEPNTGVYPLPAALCTAHPDCVFAAAYNTHAYFNCGFDVTVVVNASQFHGGSLIVLAMAEGLGDITPADSSTWFNFPHAIINLANSNSATLKLPYIGITPNTSTEALHNYWTILFAPLTPLAVPTGAPTSVKVSLLVATTACTLNGLRFPVPYPTPQHWKTRVVPGASTYGSVVAGQEIPLVGYAPAAPPRNYLPGRVHNWLEYAARHSWERNVLWTTAEEVGAQLVTYPIQPQTIAGTQTNTAFVLSLYSQWRGSLQISLIFTGPAQCYGRLLLAYTPPSANPPTTIEEANNGTYDVWDVNGDSTYTFTVPFCSQSYWKTVDIGSSSGLVSNNGYFTVFVMNPLVTPGPSPPSATVAAFLHVAEDFDVRLPQAPALGFQSGADGAEVQPAPTSDLSDGNPETDPAPRDNFDYPHHPVDPSTDLAFYFSQYRWFGLNEDLTPLAMTGGLFYHVSLNPINFQQSSLLSVLGAFTYIYANLSLNLTISAPNESASFYIFYAPPGSSVPTAQSVAEMSFFTHTVTPLNLTSSTNVTVSIPYASPQSVLCTSFGGFGLQNGGDAGNLHSNTWGTLVFYVDLPSSLSVSVSAYISFRDFEAYIPRQTPGVGTGNPSTGIVRVARPTPKPRRVRRQGGNLADLILTPESRCYIVAHTTAPFYSLLLVNPDEEYAIGMTPHGDESILAYSSRDGTRYHPTAPAFFLCAAACVGTVFPYSIAQSHLWLSDLTGVPLRSCPPLTLFLSAGAALCAGAQTLIAVAQGGALPPAPPAPSTALARRQGLGDLPDAAKNLSAALENVARVAGDADIATSSQAIASSISSLSNSIDGATTFMQNFFSGLAPKTPVSPLQHLFSKLIKWVTKIVGSLIIICNNPTPSALIGVSLMLCGDLAEDLTSFFSSLGNPLAAVFYRCARALGLSPTPQSAAQAAGGRQGVRDYNDIMNALRNTDWFFEKVMGHVKNLLEWLGVLVKDDPRTKLAQQHDKILELYTDSVTASSTPASELSADAIRSNLELAKQLLTLAHGANSVTHINLCSRAITNYSTALSAISLVGTPGTRPEPLVVYLYGPPGTGKSLLASLLASTLAQALSGDPNNYYSPSSPDCKYYDGYTGQPVHYIDDIGQNPDGADWADFVNIVSSAPFIVPMADVNDKGRFYTSRIIIVTSNFPGPNPRSARCVAALERRLHVRINVTAREGVTFSAAEALKPISPPRSTRYCKFSNPLTEFSMFSLAVDYKSVVLPNTPVSCFDELVDFILHSLSERNSVSTLLSGMVRTDVVRQGATDSPNLPLPSVLPSVPSQDPFVKAVNENRPVSFLSKLWSWRAPVFAATSFLSLIAATLTIVRCLRDLRNPQGAYNGAPVPKPRKKDLQKQPTYTGPVRRQGFDPAVMKIMANVDSFVSLSGTKPIWTMSCLWIGGRNLIVPSHAFESDDLEITHIRVGSRTFDVSRVTRVDDGELSLIAVPDGPEHKSLIRFIRPASPKSGILASKFSDTPVFVSFWNGKPHSTPLPGVVDEKDSFTYRCSSFQGLCGSPMIATDPGGLGVLGIHVAGVAGYNGFSARLTPERVQNFISQLATPQSVLHYHPPMGPPAHVSRRSRLHPSPAFGAFPITKEPAALSRKDPRLPEGTDLDAITLAKHDKGDIPTPCILEAEAADWYFSLLPDSLPVLSQEDAIRGLDHMDGIDLSQSPGYPWTTMGRSRRSLFDADGNPTPDLQEAIDAVWDGGSYIYQSFLKDELRPTAKARAGKTRIVEAAPIQAIVVGRRLLGSLINHIQGNPLSFGSAVGCNPDIHWTQIFHSLTPFPNVWSIDYSCFDATIPSCLLHAIATRIAKRSDQPGRVLDYLSYTTCSTHVYDSLWYTMIGGNPSGCVGTSILNTIANNIAIISAMMYCNKFDPRDPPVLYCYGDDLIWGSNQDFHPRELQAFYQKFTNFVVTPADKASDFPDTSSIFDITFLKRYFVPDDIHSHLIHPVMDPETLTNSIMWLRGGEFEEVLRSLETLAFHSGPKNYSDWCGKIKAKVNENGCDVTFTPYSVLQRGWVSSCMTGPYPLTG